jgi:3-hydroxyisobutyrate dehydrogenase-like beta-hydroxyacid dehydrogenase
MQIGMIGLGRMGGNMARRLTKGGHQCVVFDRNRENVNALAKEGPAPAYSLEELVEKLSAPRALWIMLPSGAPTEKPSRHFPNHWNRATRSSTAAIRTTSMTFVAQRNWPLKEFIMSTWAQAAASGDWNVVTA